MSTTASHYSQHALSSLRRRPYHPHTVASPSPTPSLSLSKPIRARPSSIGSISSLVPATPQFSMIDFLRSQATIEAPPRPRPLTVVGALAHSPNFGYAALPTSPGAFSEHALPPSTPSTASRTPSKKPPPPARSTSGVPVGKKNRDSAIVSFFRGFAAEPEPQTTLRPLLLAPAARPATPNPNRKRVREDPALVIAATESRTIPIGGRRAAHMRAKRRQWEESFAGGRPSLSLDIDSEMSYPSERIDTPVDYVHFAHERRWSGKA